MPRIHLNELCAGVRTILVTLAARSSQHTRGEIQSDHPGAATPQLEGRAPGSRAHIQRALSRAAQRSELP